MLRSLTQRQQERVWELWREGRSAHAIGRELGTYYQYVLRCLHVTGGIKPPPRRRAQRQLSISEREQISRGPARGDSFTTIPLAIVHPHTPLPRDDNRHSGLTSQPA